MKIKLPVKVVKEVLGKERPSIGRPQNIFTWYCEDTRDPKEYFSRASFKDDNEYQEWMNKAIEKPLIVINACFGRSDHRYSPTKSYDILVSIYKFEQIPGVAFPGECLISTSARRIEGNYLVVNVGGFITPNNENHIIRAYKEVRTRLKLNYKSLKLVHTYGLD